MRVYGGEIICSSSRTWVYMSRKISSSPGNTKGGAGWRNCQSWFCVVDQACHAAVFPSVRNASFMSSPGRFDLFVKAALHAQRANTSQALWSRAGSSRVAIAGRGSGPLPRVTKGWMALWPVDHAALVDTSESPRTAPTSRLGSVT